MIEELVYNNILTRIIQAGETVYKFIYSYYVVITEAYGRRGVRCRAI